MSRVMASSIFWRLAAWALGAGLEVDLGELAHPVHQIGHLGVEGRLHLLLGDRGVLDHVMQDGRDETLVVHAHLHREDARHRDRVVDVRLAGLAPLALVRLGPKQIGAIDLRDLLRREVSPR